MAGVFSGLNEIIEKMAGKKVIGFASELGSRQHIYIQDALKEFGFLDELVNRIGCVVTLPDPTLSNLEKATATVIQHGFNQLLLTRGIALHLSDSAVRLIARYAIETKSFDRGSKQVLASIAEELLFDPKPTVVLIEKADARRAIERLAGEIVEPDGGGDAVRPVGGSGFPPAEADPEAGAEAESAGC